LKKLSSILWTDKWLICIPNCHVSCTVLNCGQYVSHFDTDYLISGLTITALARVYCTQQVTVNKRIPTQWLRMWYKGRRSNLLIYNFKYMRAFVKLKH
jgi:hypothetical protein